MLEGKTALVAGTSRGVGRQVALTLGREGAIIIVDYNSSTTKTEEVVKEIKAVGGKTEAAQRNVPDLESCGRMMANMVFRYDRLDTLVSNAGITRDNLLMKMPEEDFDVVISTNLKGVFSCIKHISRQILEQKAGRIINISSVSEVPGSVGQANHCTAKTDVIGITKSTARKLASRGVTVNAVAPDLIVTEMTDVLSDSVKAATTEQIPIKHFGNTQGTAETVTPLASSKARYITGQVLNVDGGMAIQDTPAYVPNCKRTRVRLV